MIRNRTVGIYTGEQIGHYGFGDEHPLNDTRLNAFWDEMHCRNLAFQVTPYDPVMASDEQLMLFHTAAYVNKVRAHSQLGEGLLDDGDTPAYKGVFEDAAHVVGSVVDAVLQSLNNGVRRAFVPIGGLHHSMPDMAAGFCVFNDVGVAIKMLTEQLGLERIAYVDIDAHHGNGIYYPFESDPRVIFADIHEDGRYCYPQSGFAYEVGKGAAKGRKLNIPLLPLANDQDFFMVWERLEDFLSHFQPEFFILNCGADSLGGDPLSHLHFTERAHAHAARQLCKMAEEFASGRIIGVGGGGYDPYNIGRAWSEVVNAFLETPMKQ